MTTDKFDRPAEKPGRTTSVRQTVVTDFLNVTWRMLTPTVLAIAIGYWLDKWLNTSPLFFLAGAIVGFSAGVYMGVRVINASKDIK